MSREIIFRGKKKHGGSWIEGYFSKDYAGVAYITTLDGVSTGAVDESTVGQFTGRTDVNLVKIWEGDLILHGESKRIIEYRSTNFCATRPSGKESILLSFSTNPKVIGNRFDNPELIK